MSSKESLGTTARSNSRETSSVDDLIARLENASGSDRELNKSIPAALGYKWNGSFAPLGRWEHEGGNFLGDEDFTGSLDSALTLIPPNYTTSIHNGPGEPETFPCTFSISQYHDGFGVTVYYDTYPTWNIDRRALGEAWGATAPIAICIAALKARAEIGGDQ